MFYSFAFGRKVTNKSVNKQIYFFFSFKDAVTCETILNILVEQIFMRTFAV